MFNVYDRDSVPPHWPADVQAWARQALANGMPVYGSPLAASQALDWWVALPWVSLAAETEGARELLRREDVADIPSVIVMWRDGTFHAGVPPRELGDLLHLYRAARLVVDAYREHGRCSALADWAPPEHLPAS